MSLYCLNNRDAKERCTKPYTNKDRSLCLNLQIPKEEQQATKYALRASINANSKSPHRLVVNYGEDDKLTTRKDFFDHKKIMARMTTHQNGNCNVCITLVWLKLYSLWNLCLFGTRLKIRTKMNCWKDLINVWTLDAIVECLRQR